jgi:hypothetical protein
MTLKTLADVRALIVRRLPEENAEITRVMFDVGYFPPNTPPPDRAGEAVADRRSVTAL